MKAAIACYKMDNLSLLYICTTSCMIAAPWEAVIACCKLDSLSLLYMHRRRLIATACLKVITCLLQHSVRRPKPLVVTEGILKFYTEERLLPKGLDRDVPCIGEWAAKMAYGAIKLVTWLDHHYCYYALVLLIEP